MTNWSTHIKLVGTIARWIEPLLHVRTTVTYLREPMSRTGNIDIDVKTQQTCLSHETRTIRTRRLYTHLKAEVYLRVHACVYTQPIYAYVNGIVIKS